MPNKKALMVLSTALVLGLLGAGSLDHFSGNSGECTGRFKVDPQGQYLAPWRPWSVWGVPAGVNARCNTTSGMALPPQR
jgi:hypothetical protein